MPAYFGARRIGKMNACDWLVTCIYICACAIVMFCVHIRCRATMLDIERYSVKRGIIAWYLIRTAGVIVIAGGVMHARMAAGQLISKYLFRA